MRPSMNNARETLAQSDWPTVVLHDFSSLGAQTNPILIEDDDAPLGSESNPILIYVEEDYGYVEDEQIKSDADTDIMATPEPWWEQMFRDSVDLLADSATDVDAEALTTPESWWDMLVDEDTLLREAASVDLASIPLLITIPMYEEKVPNNKDEKGRFLITPLAPINYPVLDSDQGGDDGHSLKLQTLPTNDSLSSQGEPTFGQDSTFGCNKLGTKKRQLLDIEGSEVRRSQRLAKRVRYNAQGIGTDDWAEAYSQARALVGQMTVEEKVTLTTGIQQGDDPSIQVGCVGFIKGVPRLGFNGMCFQDAGNGVRSSDGVSAYPAGITGAASWNRSGVYHRGFFLGKEFKARNWNTLLGPVISPMGRVVLGGRVWEGFGPDPYLSGELSFETVSGIQKSVIVCVKHFIGNEQETNRVPAGANESVSANIDDKTLHEQYLYPFQSAVRADWGATYTQTASVNAGLDIAMPAPRGFAGNLTQAVANGTVSDARLSDMATRILASYFQFAPFQIPGFGQPQSDLPGLNKSFPYVDARDPASKSTLLQGAVEGIVLVKNTNNILPFKAPKVLSLFGYDGPAPHVEAASLTGYYIWGLGYSSVNVTIEEHNARFLSGNVDPANVPNAAYAGTLITGGGSGSNTPAYISSPFEAFSQQAWIDGTWVNWDFVSQNPSPDVNADACIVFINAWAAEGYDRTSLTDEYSDTLVANVASQCPNTIVVIHNAGIRIVDAFYDHPNVTAILYAHLPGQDSGRALVEVMYGKQSPSGRLPYTVAKRAEDQSINQSKFY